MPFGSYSSADVEDIQSARDKTDDLLLERAQTALGIPEEQLVARDLDPEKDLEQSNPEYLFTGLTADSDNTIINITVDDNKFIGIYGVAINTASPNEKRLTLKSGAKTLDLIHLEGIQALEEPITVLSVPTIITQNSDFTADLWVTNNNDSKLTLLGRTVEKAGQNIAPRSE